MEIDTHLLSDEQINKINEAVAEMLKENLYKKWWIMPKYPIFSSEVQMYGQSYYVEPQQDTYSRNKPPLKSDFNTKEEAQKWLDDYLHEEDLFLKAIDEINNLNRNLGHLVDKLRKHERITNTDLNNCFESFNASWDRGSIREVIVDKE